MCLKWLWKNPKHNPKKIPVVIIKFQFVISENSLIKKLIGILGQIKHFSSDLEKEALHSNEILRWNKKYKELETC